MPKVYLRNFCDSKHSISVLNKNNNKTFSSGIRVVGVENDFYTLNKLENPYYWEQAYATGIEPLMGQVLPNLISKASFLVQNRAMIFSPTDKVQLSLIMVMQLLRGKQSREYERQLYQDKLPDTIKAAKEKFGELNDQQKALLDAFETDEYYLKLTSVDVVMDTDRIVRYAKELCNRCFILYRILGKMEFITSDNPVMFQNTITNNVKPFTNGITKVSTAIYYPISPKLMLCAMHPDSFFGAFAEIDGRIIDLDVDHEREYITLINQKQIEQCYQYAYAQSESALKSIFD